MAQRVCWTFEALFVDEANLLLQLPVAFGLPVQRHRTTEVDARRGIAVAARPTILGVLWLPYSTASPTPWLMPATHAT